MTTLKMAFFSLFSHKNKTLLILIILSLSACLTLLGFTTYNTFEQNMRKSLTETVSGDIIIHNSSQNTNIDILETSQYINPIEDYKELTETLDEFDVIEQYTPLSRGTVLLHDPRSGDYNIPLSVIGANIDDYMNIFKKMKVIDGTLIPEGESGILISKSAIEAAEKMIDTMMEKMKENSSDNKEQTTENNQEEMKNTDQKENIKNDVTEKDGQENNNMNSIKNADQNENNTEKADQNDTTNENNSDKPDQNENNNDKGNIFSQFTQNPEMMKSMIRERFKVGNTIKMAGISNNMSMRIMELKIYGIIDMENADNIPSQFSLIDTPTYQKLTGYDAVSNVMTIEQLKTLEENRKYMLEFEVEDEDSGKGAFDVSSIENFFDDMIDEEAVEYEEEVNEEDFALDLDKYKKDQESIITETSDKTGKSDFIILRLKDPNMIDDTVKKLNAEFTNKEMDFKAINYLESSISLGSYISLSLIIISLIIFLILIISIIIITNAILMSVIDRTSEIGTMMAIGAKKGFIFKMILGESIITSIFTSLIGMIIGGIVIFVISLIGIPANDTITMMLFGGKVMTPVASGMNFIITFILVFIVTMISTIYPLVFSTRLTPLQAMSKV